MSDDKLMKEERRRHKRVELGATATVLTEGRHVGQFPVENLSASGALLLGDSDLNPKDRVKVLLHLPNESPLGLNAEVVERRRTASGQRAFALAFSHLTPEMEVLLQEIVLVTTERQSELKRPAVLVIDDSIQICRALERDLKQQGHRVLTATNPLEAMTQLNAEPLIGMAIIDARLGHADGLELVGFLAESHPDIRRVLMSGMLETWQLELARSFGKVHAVLNKPWTRQSLARVLNVES